MPSKKSLNVLIAASEGVPYSKTGGLGDVVGALPGELAALGFNVAVALPRYRSTRIAKPKTVVNSLTVPLGDGLHFPSIVEDKSRTGVRWLFVDYPAYFDRDSLYVGPSGADYPDNPQRYALFSRCVVEIAKNVFPSHLIHCNDWQTSLVPVLMKTLYGLDPALQGVPSVFTIHNLGFQGIFPQESLTRAALPPELYRTDRMEFYGKVNFMKGALNYADYITTVSRKYSHEIQTAEYGFGLEGVLKDKASHIRGILNGVDYGEWDPAVDANVAVRYDAADLSGKKECKRDLLCAFGLPDDDPSIPVIGIVSRFTRQKGFDLIAECAETLMSNRLRIVALGTGEARYERLFTSLAAKYRNKLSVRVAYDDALSHKIEAGSDMFLMPSQYEPCGLNQIYSLRYGTVPIVRATGGLDDTIQDYDPATGSGTGFKFTSFTGAALMEAVGRAIGVYAKPEEWKRLMLNGMRQDYSWKRSAKEYLALYKELTENRGLGLSVSPKPSAARRAKRPPRSKVETTVTSG